MKYIFRLLPWVLAAVVDIAVMIAGIFLWAVTAPGVAVIAVPQFRNELALRLIPQEFVHEFDAIALWAIILFACGFLLAWINFYFSEIRGVLGLLFSMIISLIVGGIVQNFGTSLSFWWMKSQIDPIIKTFPPHSQMGLFYNLENLPQQQLGVFHIFGLHINLTTFIMQYAILFAGIVGVSTGYLVRTLLLPVPKFNHTLV